MNHTGMSSTVHGTIAGNVTMTSQINSMMDDDLSEPSSPESGFDTSDFLQGTVTDDVTAQLAAAGPVGIAAAAAIATGKKKGHPHQFETNPSRRERQQTRLLRKLKSTIEEYTTRVGQQAVVLCCTPGKPSQTGSSFKVFGSQPLESVIRNCRGMVIQELETSLQDQAPQSQCDNSHLHELPLLVIDGIPTQVDKMTQAQLRNFIPEMLKYSTGRSKPGWGKPECRPVWWPSDLPWANVRSDARSDDEKKRVSWTEALRTIVKNCYKHHGREDLLHVFNDDGTTQAQAQTHAASHYQGTMVQTINNPDGTVSIIHIDTGPTGNSVVTLPDGTQATVVHAVTAQQLHDNHQQEATQAVQTLAEVAANHQEVGQLVTPVSVEMADNTATVTTLTGASINSSGQIIFTGDGSLGGIVTIPASVYHTVASSMGTIGDNPNVQIAMAPLTQLKTEVPDATQAVEVTSIDQGQNS
ncbi:DNA-binding protein P3A2-like [Haliotis rubra]|uniref:DNA-binding protein P3A2-like n=1 Tax=Haliotis rubra TaxID=36100 RepID=UPI001EE5A923|nr:DNA-binding protein P3A2-like [Haliotis rubra]XP_046580612.1 DNA-binding protein P3A2-like [Haliotis rubra]XP_046580620.1 DNA-binding protein P3A2-like [Haliotis rubra]